VQRQMFAHGVFDKGLKSGKAVTKSEYINQMTGSVLLGKVLG